MTDWKVIALVIIAGFLVGVIDHNRKGNILIRGLQWLFYGIAMVGLYGHFIIQELKRKSKVDNDE